MCTVYVSSILGGQKRASYALEWLQTTIWVLRNKLMSSPEQQVSLAAEISPAPITNPIITIFLVQFLSCG